MRYLLTTTRSDNAVNSNVEGDENPREQKKILDFLTVQSLSFPLASAAVTAAWKILQEIFGDWADDRITPLGIAVLIILASIAGQWTELGKAPARISAIAIGAVNCLLLTAGALGIVLGLP